MIETPGIPYHLMALQTFKDIKNSLDMQYAYKWSRLNGSIHVCFLNIDEAVTTVCSCNYSLFM